MHAYNQVMMAVLIALLLLVVNQFIPLNPVINLLFNFIMLVAMVIYLMQFFGVLTAVLPVVKFFK